MMESSTLTQILRPVIKAGPDYSLGWESNHAWEQLKQEECLFMDEATLDRLFRIGRPRGFYRLFLDVSKDEPVLHVDPWPRLAVK